MKKIRILAFGHIPTWAGGRQTQGAANVIYNLALNMSRLPDAEVHLGCTDVFKETIVVENLTIHGWTKSTLIKYIFFHPILSLRYFSNLIDLRKQVGEYADILGMFFKGIHLRRCADKIKPDIVHLHGIDAVTYSMIIPSNIKIVVTLHGLFGNDCLIPNYQENRMLEKRIWHSERIERLFLVSSKLLSDCMLLYGKNNPTVEVILNAYNDEFFYYVNHVKNEKLTVLTIASMSDRKGQERVLEGLILNGLSCRYICIGSIDENIAKKMTNKAKNSNVEIEILGMQEPSYIREILKKVDYMILPSSSEGFGLVFLEAMACGVPVILPKDLPIVQEGEIIQPGLNALLLDDCSSESINNIIPQMLKQKFDPLFVSQSVLGYTWAKISAQYIKSLLVLVT